MSGDGPWTNVQKTVYSGSTDAHDLDREQSLAAGLTSIDAEFIGEVELYRPDLDDFAHVAYTVIRYQERVLLFAENRENTYGHSDPVTTALLYSEARAVWAANFDVPFPPFKSYLPDWVSWLHDQTPKAA